VPDSAEVAAHSAATTTRTALTEDTAYDRGVAGSITRGVDPDGTHDGTDFRPSAPPTGWKSPDRRERA
jgi:hypothetical protein